MQPNNRSSSQIIKGTVTEQARQKQIIDATITVLAEVGYVNTSFVRIARKAGITTSLISYHFRDKAELTNAVRSYIYQARYEHVHAAVQNASGSREKLRIYINSDVAYMSSQPHLFRALVEILFGQRDKDGLPSYMKDVDAPMVKLLHEIIQEGQKVGQLGVALDSYTLAHVIDGAKDQFLAQVPFRPSLDVDLFARTLTNIALNAGMKEN